MALVSPKALQGQFPYYFVVTYRPLRHDKDGNAAWPIRWLQPQESADTPAAVTDCYATRAKFTQAKTAEAAARGLIDMHKDCDIVVLFTTALGAVTIHSTIHKGTAA